MFGLIICFIIPLLAYFKLSLIGEVSATEIVLIVIGLFNVGKFQRLWADKRVRFVVALAVAWFIMNIASDLYRNTPIEDLMRGAARILVLVGSLFAVGSLVGNNKYRIIAFAMGHFCSIVLFYLIYGTDLPFYKFIVGMAISGAAFFLAGFLDGSCNPISRLIPFFAGVLALFQNARSLAGITLLAALYPLLYTGGGVRAKVLKSNVLLPIVFLCAAAVGIIAVYKAGASSGVLGGDALEKYTMQTSSISGEYSVMDGRMEVMFSWPKIQQSPIIGWGSWARDLVYVMDRKAQLGLNVAAQGERDSPDLIPAHSHFFAAWLEAGVVGGIFWLLILAMTVKALLANSLSFMGKYRAFGVFLLMMFLWDIVFSPFGGERRVFNGFLIWVVIVALKHVDYSVVNHRNRGKILPAN